MSLSPTVSTAESGSGRSGRRVFQSFSSGFAGSYRTIFWLGASLVGLQQELVTLVVYDTELLLGDFADDGRERLIALALIPKKQRVALSCCR